MPLSPTPDGGGGGGKFGPSHVAHVTGPPSFDWSFAPGVAANDFGRGRLAGQLVVLAKELVADGPGTPLGRFLGTHLPIFGGTLRGIGTDRAGGCWRHGGIRAGTKRGRCMSGMVAEEKRLHKTMMIRLHMLTAIHD